MKSFILRIIPLFGLWLAFFLYGYEGTLNNFYSLLICAGVLTLYFFLSIAPKPIYLYVAIQALLLLQYGMSPTNSFTLLLLVYFSILAVQQLASRAFKLLAAGTMITLFGICIFVKTSIFEFLFICLFYFIAICGNELWMERKEQRDVYEELLGEYRRLKRLLHSNEEEARNEERTKIARDIHDSVGHKLTALLMQLEILSIKHGEEKYDQLKELAKESLEETRYAVRTLNEDEHEGITTILQLIKKLESESHILVHFTTKQGVLSEKLTNQQSVVLYRVIQEGLTNAMRHAHSKEVFVILGKSAIGSIEFTVKNRVYNQDPFEEGFGLHNMRKRVEELGGTLSIYRTEDDFVLTGNFPVRL